jgi:hypothetical protein
VAGRDWDRASSARMNGRRRKKRIKALECDLQRKEKALAEAAAARSQKKPRHLGGRRRRMISAPDRQRAVELIDEDRRDRASSRPVPSCGSVNEPIAAGRSRASYGRSAAEAPRPTPATSCLTKTLPFWMSFRNSRAAARSSAPCGSGPPARVQLLPRSAGGGSASSWPRQTARAPCRRRAIAPPRQV